MMSIYSVLQSTNLPCVYAGFKKKGEQLVTPPYISYIGDGQNVLEADNTHYWRKNKYQIGYYFTTKNESNEASIENALLNAGYLYDKSEDVPVNEEGVFVIYYYV